MLTFLRTEEAALEFIRWCQYYRVPHLRDAGMTDDNHRANSAAGLGRRSFRRLHGLERKLLRVLNEFFYCGVCLPPNDLAL